MEYSDDRQFELFRLITSGHSRISEAWLAYMDALEEENAKIKDFFEKNKDEIAFPASVLSNHSGNDLLTRNFKFKGYNRGFFCLSGGIKITADLINAMVFMTDDQKMLLNEVAASGNNLKNKLEFAKYAVILYPTVSDNNTWDLWRFDSAEQFKRERPNSTFSIYIGKIIKDEGYGHVSYSMKDEKHEHFPIRDKLLLDSVFFDSNKNFDDYITKNRFFQNGNVTDLTSLPLPE